MAFSALDYILKSSFLERLFLCKWKPNTKSTLLQKTQAMKGEATMRHVYRCVEKYLTEEGWAAMTSGLKRQMNLKIQFLK